MLKAQETLEMTGSGSNDATNSPNNSVAYLAKKIEQAHVVWFEAINQWVQFDEQQWLIFCFYKKGLSQKSATKKYCTKYSLPEVDAKSIIENFYTSVSNLFNPPFEKPNFTLNSQGASIHIPEKTKTQSYRHCNKTFGITYGSAFLENYIHLPLAHLETDENSRPSLRLEVFPIEGRFILRINGVGGRCLSAEEPGQIKRLLYIELVNFFYNKQSSDWLSFAHASALRRNDQAILLTASGGSGKSTLAGLLQLNGFEFLSDDFVPIDSISKKAFPFPAALCVKNNAIKLLEDKGMEFTANPTKSTAYAKPLHNWAQAKACKMSKVVFLKYNPQVELVFETLPTLDALYIFLQEAWVGDDMKRAKKFINWFSKLSFYKLEYGNNNKAIEVLTKLTDKA
jgi:hypothetical protein